MESFAASLSETRARALASMAVTWEASVESGASRSSAEGSAVELSAIAATTAPLPSFSSQFFRVRHSEVGNLCHLRRLRWLGQSQ